MFFVKAQSRVKMNRSYLKFTSYLTRVQVSLEMSIFRPTTLVLDRFSRPEG